MSIVTLARPCNEAGNEFSGTWKKIPTHCWWTPKIHQNPSIKVTPRISQVCLFFVFSLPLLLGIAWFCYFSTSPIRSKKNPPPSVPRRNAGSSTVPLRTVKGALEGEGAKDAAGGRNQANNLGGAIKPSLKISKIR